MIYSREVEEMCPVAQGVHHGAAPIPEEAKWVQAKEVKDISGLTHGVGWCAPQQGACKLSLNVKNGVIEEALVETIGCSGMTHSAAPGDPVMGGSGAFFKQAVGSGDIPVSTLPMALNVALLTIGLELVPVIPAKGPWALLTYLDFPYAGGKLGGKNEIVGLDGRGEGAENKPLYFKVLGSAAEIADRVAPIRWPELPP